MYAVRTYFYISIHNLARSFYFNVKLHHKESNADVTVKRCCGNGKTTL